MSRYTSKHTGSEIDTAVDRANGYGLGKDATVYISDANTATKAGWYYWGKGAVNTPSNYGAILVIPRYSSITTQLAFLDEGGVAASKICVRERMDGVWGGWEWVNPPMVAGVEYRTTERYNNKPVYVKLVDLGNCPSSSYKNVTVLGATEVGFRCEGTWTYGGGSTLPFESSSSDRMEIAIIDKNVRIFTGGKDFSTYTAKAKIYYTKTTD